MSRSRVYSMPLTVTDSIVASEIDLRAALSRASVTWVSGDETSTEAVPDLAARPSTFSASTFTGKVFTAPLSDVA